MSRRSSRPSARSLSEGEQVLLVDAKRRSYLITLASDGEFHTHTGVLRHADVIGNQEGSVVQSSGGVPLVVLRPTLAEFVLKMPRGAQVIYPKDLGPMLLLADISPGCRVLESGVGSGALSMTLLRAGADVVGYELRQDFATRAHRNVTAFLEDDVTERYRIEVRDVYDGITESDLDRVVLDLPEPWRAVKHAARALRRGGLLVAYTPQITQAARLREALGNEGFGLADTMEVLNRGWHIDGQSVRPDHRMVAHTGFLSSARFLG